MKIYINQFYALLAAAVCLGEAVAKRGGGSSGGSSGSRSNSSSRGGSSSKSSSSTSSSSASRSITGKTGKTLTRSSTVRKAAGAAALVATTRSLTSRKRSKRRKSKGFDDEQDEDDYVEIEAEYDTTDGVTIYTVDVDNDFAPTLCMYHYADDDDVDDDGDDALYSYCVVPWSFGDTLFSDLQWSNLDVLETGDYTSVRATANGDINVTLELYVSEKNLDSPFGGDPDDNQLLANSGKYRIQVDQGGDTLTQLVYSTLSKDFQNDISALQIGGEEALALTWPEVTEGEEPVTTESSNDIPDDADDEVASGYRLGGSPFVLRHTFDDDDSVDFPQDMEVELEVLGLEDDRPTAVGAGDQVRNTLSVLMALGAAFISLVI